MQSVELRPAFWWCCEDCGRDNFARSVPVTHAMVESLIVADQVEDEDVEDLRDQPGDFWVAPEAVRCGHCGAEFGVEGE